MAFYRLNAKGVYVPMTREEKEIIKSIVLPGFQFRISDLAQPPTVEELISTEAEIRRYFPLTPGPSPKGRGAKENRRKFLLQYLAAPVYQGFVLPGYQEAKRQAAEWRVAQETPWADLEASRADLETPRADLIEQRAWTAESELARLKTTLKKPRS